MKKLILILVMCLTLTMAVFAENTITIDVETNDFATYTDTTELYLEAELNEDTIASITVTATDLMFENPVVVTIDGALDFTLEEGTAQLGAGIDLSTNDIYVKGKILNYSLTDDMDFNAKAKYNIGADYWAVANVVYTGEETEFIVEGRYDSDGYVLYSAEAQLTFALADDIDLTFGYEMNGWDDDINDWDAMSISDDLNTAYGKLVIRF